MGGFYLGLDAGATRCRARLRDASGAALGEAQGPAANPYVDFAAAAATARATAAAALAQAGVEAGDVQAGLGVAGVSSEPEAARFAAEMTGFAGVAVVNDAVTACMGAHAGRDGGLLIVGTGSAGVARVGGRTIIVGGRGFHLGDDGSAARLGLEAARAAMRAADGLGPESALTRRILARFEGDPLAMVAFAAKATSGDWGGFAPFAIEAAEAGDELARALVAASAEAVATLAARIEALGAPRVAMVGGLGEALRPFLRPEVAARLLAPLHDPTDGAILLAGGALPGPSR